MYSIGLMVDAIVTEVMVVAPTKKKFKRTLFLIFCQKEKTNKFILHCLIIFIPIGAFNTKKKT